MTDLTWLLPAVLAVVVIAAAVVALRARRRSARTRESAERSRTAAEAALVRLDEAAMELDLAFEASDALVGDDVSDDLRRARAAVIRARDRGLADIAALAAAHRMPAALRTEADHVRARLDDATARATATRAALARWADAHRTPAARIDAAHRRRDAAAAGDLAPLLDTLRRRFDERDRRDADLSAARAADALDAADAALSAAASDPGRLDDHLFTATDATRRAAPHRHAVEDAHRAALVAADNAAAELTAARAELMAAQALAETRPAECALDAAPRLVATLHDLDAAAATATRRPRAAIEAVARSREVCDAVLDGAEGARQRREAARAALPGTLACARAALAAAEANEDDRSLDDRLRLDAARRALADARTAADPVTALDAARAAWHAAAPH